MLRLASRVKCLWLRHPEMTGLFMDSCHANYLDDMQDR